MQTSTRPRKILYVITKGSWGGASAYVETLAQEVAHLPNTSVSVLTGSRGELTERLQKTGIRTDTIPMENSLRPHTLYTEVLTTYHYLQEHTPDVVHINSNKAGIVTSIAATLYNLRNKKKIHSLFTIHGHAFNEARSWFARGYITLAEMVIFTLVDTIICVSKKVYEDIPCSALFAKKTVVIYNGIGTIPFMERMDARGKLKITDHSVPHFVTVAELNDNKNHVFLLRELATYTQPFMYHIIGAGTLEPTIRAFIKKHNLDEKVILHGHLRDAAHYLKAFDLFILPSKTEAFAYVIQEAGQAGIKTIASRVGGLPELLPDNLLFSLHNKDELRSLLATTETLPPHTTYFKQADMVEQTVALYS